MWELQGMCSAQSVVNARFESRATEAELIGQKSRERVQFGHNQQSTWGQKIEYFAEDAKRVVEMVHGRRGPNEVDRRDVGPGLVKVNFDCLYPV
jgi:hypothetical protein